MVTPRVSVVITCYNYGKYLNKCLQSALLQTYPELEVIVVNDGSTDDTELVMQRYLSDRRVVYLRQDNSGQAVAKNVGVGRATGEFVAFLDADDLWCPDKLEKQLKLFDDPEVGVVYCRAKYVDAHCAIVDHQMTDPYLQPQRGRVTDRLFLDNFVQFSSAVVRAECLELFGAFDESLKMAIDWDLWLRISTRYRFDFVDEPLFYYRLGHPGQMSKNLGERQRCSDLIMSRFLERFPSAVSRRTVRDAYVHTFCNRGYYYRSLDSNASTVYYLRALQQNPLALPPYVGLLKNWFRSLKRVAPRPPEAE